MDDASVSPIALARLSLNQASVNRLTLPEAVQGCVRHGIGVIAVWRDKVAACGLRESVQLVRDAGLHVSSVCRGGYFPGATAAERQERLDDNVRAVDEAAAFEADCLVLVSGPVIGRDIDGARRMVADALAQLVPYARERGVKLAIEPLHPMFAADRSVVVTLGQALDLAMLHEAGTLGVIVDVFHLWWDPELYTQVARARGRVFGYHVSDWAVPLPGILTGRSMMGDGVIELRRIRRAVEQAGYHGPVEVEIFNDRLWAMPGDEALALIRKRFLETC